ncbi:MAG TPA: hypothetical protein VGG26_08385 [Terracidiphilus sp.]
MAMLATEGGRGIGLMGEAAVAMLATEGGRGIGLIGEAVVAMLATEGGRGIGLMGEAVVAMLATEGGRGIGLMGEAAVAILATDGGRGIGLMGEAIAVETNIAKAALIDRALIFIELLYIAVRSLVLVAKRDYPKLCSSSSTKVTACLNLGVNRPF